MSYSRFVLVLLPALLCCFCGVWARGAKIGARGYRQRTGTENRHCQDIAREEGREN